MSGSLNAALAMSPQAVADEPPPGDPAACWYIYRAADDERVCPECGPLDGVEVNGAWVWLFPPLHTNCRCWLEPWYCDEPEPPPDHPSDDPALVPPGPPAGAPPGGPF